MARLLRPVESFMEWVARTGMDMEWVLGGCGYFLVKSYGAGGYWGKDTNMYANWYLYSYSFLTI